jgi:outer membrane biosynthesis protein TonB
VTRVQPADRRSALLASAALHAAVLLAGLIAWPWNKPIRMGEVVPVTIVTSQTAANIKPAIESPTPTPAATQEPEPAPSPLPPAPEEAPVPTPPPTVKTPPQPHPKTIEHPQPQPKPAPTPKPTPVPKPVAQPKPTPPPPKPLPPKPAQPAFDPDAVLASLEKNSHAAGARHSAAPRGPTRPETAVQARLAPGAGSAVGQAALADLGSQLARLWNPNCQVEGGADVVVNVTFQLGPGGRLLGQPQSSAENSPNPIVKVASDRAKRAVFQGAPFDSLPQALYGQRITVNFNAKQYCANR